MGSQSSTRLRRVPADLDVVRAFILLVYGDRFEQLPDSAMGLLCWICAPAARSIRSSSERSRGTRRSSASGSQRRRGRVTSVRIDGCWPSSAPIDVERVEQLLAGVGVLIVAEQARHSTLVA